jgi:hypothetical protein
MILSKEANASEVAITQEPPRFPSTALAVALRLFKGLLRRAISNTAAPPRHWTHRLLRQHSALPVCRGQRSPTLIMCDWRRCRSSQLCCPALFLGAAPPSSSPLYMPTPPNDLQLMSRVLAVDEDIIAWLQRRERQHPSSNGSSRATSKRVSLPHPSTQGG